VRSAGILLDLTDDSGTLGSHFTENNNRGLFLQQFKTSNMQWQNQMDINVKICMLSTSNVSFTAFQSFDILKINLKVGPTFSRSQFDSLTFPVNHEQFTNI
jgi:hypothetical protein